VTRDDFLDSGVRIYRLREVSDGSPATSRVAREKRLLASLSLQFAVGITVVLADMITFQTLMNYSLSDIRDGIEREKSLMLIKHLFLVLHKDINRSNLFAASVCGATSFVAGIIPIMVYFLLPKPLNIILSPAIVGTVAGFFLVRYRSRKSKVRARYRFTAYQKNRMSPRAFRTWVRIDIRRQVRKMLLTILSSNYDA
jgi:VIT1/CCC1 family predicted Fe2+/Mn2+ transporter